MKKFARWLYMKMYRQELIEVKRYVTETRKFGDMPGSSFERGMTIGALDTLRLLELLV